MALEKFTWENGSQVEPAKVEIEGVSYDVVDAQYEGATPLSSANLNLMQDTILGNVVDDLDDDTKIPSVKAVKGTVLWTNPNPSSDMGNNVQITLSSDDYDLLEVFVIYSKNNQSIMRSHRFVKGKGGMLMVSSAEGTPTVILRNLNYNSDTSFTLTIGKLNQLTTNTVTDNTSGCIPVYIVGYKAGL